MYFKHIINDIVRDINSCDDFSIIASEEFQSLAFKSHEMMLNKKNRNFPPKHSQKDDFLIAISKSGREGKILEEVKSAMKRKVKIYAVCADFRSPLALFAENAIVLTDDEDFSQKLEEILSDICDNISSGENVSKKRVIGDPSPDEVKSSFAGAIIKLNVNVGDRVGRGDVLYVLEAMKMEIQIESDRKGVVYEIFFKEGDSLNKDDVVMMVG